jgi:hypothetical protein
METTEFDTNTVNSSKTLVIAILIIIILKNLFDVLVGGSLSIIQVIVDVFLVVLLFSQPYFQVKKFVIARAFITLPFWVIWSFFSSGLVLAVIVLFEEIFVSVPLLMLLLGKQSKIKNIVAMGMFLILGFGSYLIMILLVI